MSETVSPDAPRTVPRFDEPLKQVKKTQPAQFPHRITFCMASDQVQSLAQAKRIFRATDSFMLRLAWDNFCRANQIAPVNNGGQNAAR